LAERLTGLVATFKGTSGDASLATAQAWASLSGTISNQAYVLAFADAFLVVTTVMGVSALLVLMLPPLHATHRSDAAFAAVPPGATTPVSGGRP
jgi:hypothetical protein